MNRSYRDPVAQVIIRDIESNHEWQWGSPKFPFLTNVSFTRALQGINAFSIGVDIPYEMGIQYLDRSQTPFKLNNHIEARIGYAGGGWTNWETGFLRDGASGLSVTPDSISGTIQASWTSTKAAGYTISKSILSDAGIDGKKLIRLAATELGLGVDFSPDVEGYLEPWLNIEEKTIEKRKAMFNGLEGKTLLSAVEEVCLKSNLQYRMGYKGKKKVLFIYTERDKLKGNSSEQDVIRTYAIRGILDESRNQYPCFSISPQGDQGAWTARTATGAASGVEAKGIDRETGDDIDVSILPRDGLYQTHGYENTEPQDIKAGDEVADSEKSDGRGATYMSAPIPKGGREIFRNQVEQFGLQGDPGQKMEIVTLGLPEEDTGNLCKIFGAGVVFNDLYSIEKLSHEWTPGHWDMRLSLNRRGKGFDVTGKKQETAGGQMTP